MQFYDLVQKFEERANSAILNSNSMLFVGARVYWRDDRNVYHFGVVYDYDESDLECSIIDDNGRPHSRIPMENVKRYGSMKTEKATGKSKTLTAPQAQATREKNTKLPARKFFTSKETVSWGLPLMRACYLFVNEVFFKTYLKKSMLFKQGILPELGQSASLEYAGAYFRRTTKIAANRNMLRSYELVTSIVGHEMIHLFDDKFRSKSEKYDDAVENGGTYDPHGKWFRSTAKKMESVLGTTKIWSSEDNRKLFRDNLDAEYEQEIGEEGPEVDRESRLGYSVEVDDDEKLEKTKPFYMVVFYWGIGRGQQKPINRVFGVRVTKYEEADRFSEMIDTDYIDPEDRRNRNLVDIYKVDMKYFEDKFTTPKKKSWDGFRREMKPIKKAEIDMLISNGESMLDGSEGGMLSYFLEKIARL